MIIRTVSFLLVFCFSGVSSGHDVFSGELQGLLNDQRQLSLKLTLASVTADTFSEDIINRNNQISKGNLPKIKDHLIAKAENFFKLTLNSKKLTPSLINVYIISEDDSVVFTFEYDLPIEGLLGIHTNFISQTNPDYKLTILLLDANKTQLGLFVHTYNHQYDQVIIDESTIKANTRGVFKSFLVLGIEHIFIGLDHILFLFALLLICRTWKEAAIIISCFTVAHTITLSLASLKLVDFPPIWVEICIAVTVIYVGIENLYYKHKPKHRWLLTCFFGLIHGLGFANVLMGLGLGAGGAPIILPLISFNLGVEIGQLFIAAIILPLFWYLSRFSWHEKKILPIISSVIIVIGVFWLLERIASLT